MGKGGHSFLNRALIQMKQIIALTVLLFAFCGSASAGWSRVSDDQIRLDGHIDRDSYDEYMKIAKDGYKELLLNSGGGYPSITLAIAEDVIKRNPMIVVDGVCISSCANYLAIAGAKLVIKCGSAVGWHGGLGSVVDESAAMRASGIPGNVVDGYAKWLSEFKRKEAEFFRTAKVDVSILSDSIGVIERSGITPEPSFTIDQVTGEYSYTTTTSLWVPAIEDIESYGIRVESCCGQQSDSDTSKSLKNSGVVIPFTSMRKDEYAKSFDGQDGERP